MPHHPQPPQTPPRQRTDEDAAPLGTASTVVIKTTDVEAAAATPLSLCEEVLERFRLEREYAPYNPMSAQPSGVNNARTRDSGKPTKSSAGNPEECGPLTMGTAGHELRRITDQPPLSYDKSVVDVVIVTQCVERKQSGREGVENAQTAVKQLCARFAADFGYQHIALQDYLQWLVSDDNGYNNTANDVATPNDDYAMEIDEQHDPNNRAIAPCSSSAQAHRGYRPTPSLKAQLLEPISTQRLSQHLDLSSPFRLNTHLLVRILQRRIQHEVCTTGQRKFIFSNLSREVEEQILLVSSAGNEVRLFLHSRVMSFY